jgi:glycosyltransferase involved in cell wall biosynthesis
MVNRRILYVQYNNPGILPPIQHSAWILAEAGWQVLFLGIGSPGVSNQLTAPPHPRIRTRSLPYCRPGWRQKVHYLWYSLCVLARVLWWRPHWVYLSDPLSCPIGLVLLLLPARVLYHEHDGPSESAQAPSPLWLRARVPLARAADLCVLPNEKRLAAFLAKTGRKKPTLCVMNCPRRDEVRRPRTSSPGSGVRLFYSGSIGTDRIPEAVIQALTRLPADVRFRAVGFQLGTSGYIDHLRRTAEKLGVADRVEFLPGRSRYQLWPLYEEADVGLSLSPLRCADPNFIAMVGATNKAFDYFAAGMPLLVSDLPEWREAYVSAGYALACSPDDPDSIARALQWFHDHPGEMRAMGEAARQRITQDWNYESQFRPVAELLRAPRGVGGPVRPAPAPAGGEARPGARGAAGDPQAPATPRALAPVLVESGRDGPAPFFSICVPQYNRTQFLIAAVRSFAEQQFRDVEVCVSDGASTDGREHELIEVLLASGVPFVYQRSPVNLRYDANTRAAVGLARGRYCVLMGNDDALNGPGALADLWADMEKHAPLGVALSDSCDYRTGHRAFRIRETVACGAGPGVAALHFRNFSFVSGVVLRRESAQALTTAKWDGSEMYQTFVGCRMIASGERLLERGAVLVRKDITIPGESVDSYAARPRLWPCPLVERRLPLNQLGRLVADAIAPHTAAGDRPRLNEAILLQLLGITYPFWLFEYRRVQSWPYAAGIALGMKPARTAAGVTLGLPRRLRVWAVYGLATALGLAVPGPAFAALRGCLYKVAKSIR